MGESAIPLVWLVIRKDDDGTRYRIGSYATRAEAEKTASSLDGQSPKQLYWVEQLG
jgi:cell division protein FtsN